MEFSVNFIGMHSYNHTTTQNQAPQVEMLHNANYRVLCPFLERSLILILNITSN